MATRVDQAYFGWSREQSTEHDDTQDVSDPQMLDHGSISFGRFQFESLEWERRSVFSHNKCQDELEKFKSPGLVAQKKAYFEEYYKKVRARKKAMEENQQMEVASDYGGGDFISTETGKDYETDVKLETIGDGASSVSDVHNTLVKSTLEGTHITVAIQSRHFDPEDAREGSLEIEQRRDISYAPQTQMLDIGCMLHESLTRIEEAGQQDMSDVDTERISMKSDKSVATMFHESLVRIEESEQQEMSDVDTERISMKSDKSEATMFHESLVRIEESEQQDMSDVDTERISMKSDKSVATIQSRHIDPEDAREGSLEIEQRRDISYAPRSQKLDMGCLLHESLTRVEEAGQQDMGDIDTERIPMKSDKSEVTMLHESFAQIEESEQQDVSDDMEIISMKSDKSEATIQSRHINPEDAREGSLEIEQRRDISYAPQSQKLDMGCMLHGLLTRVEDTGQQDMSDIDTERISMKSDKSEVTMLHESLTQIEESEQQDVSDVDMERISMKSDKSEATIEQDKNSCIYDVPIYGSESSDRQPTVLESLMATEEIEHQEEHSLDLEQVSRKFGSLEADIAPVVSNRSIVLNSTDPNAEDSVLKADCNTISEKDEPTVNRKKEDRVPVSKVKAYGSSGSSIRDNLKLDIKNQTTTKSSARAKYPFQRATVKANNGVVSGKTTDCRLSRNNKSSQLISPRSQAEVRSNCTTPRPFSFASERRSSLPAFSRGIEPNLSSKTPNGLAAPLNQSKDVINVQENSKKASITYGAKSRGIENKRVCGEVRKGALILNKQQCTDYKKNGTNIPGTSKNRLSTSLNLPATAQSNEKVASESRISGRKDNQDEKKDEANSKEGAVGKKTLAPRTRNLKTESKKVPLSQTNHLPFPGTKTKIGGLSHDGIKPRQEMPRWR